MVYEKLDALKEEFPEWADALDELKVRVVIRDMKHARPQAIWPQVIIGSVLALLSLVALVGVTKVSDLYVRTEALYTVQTKVATELTVLDDNIKGIYIAIGVSDERQRDLQKKVFMLERRTSGK